MRDEFRRELESAGLIGQDADLHIQLMDRFYRSMSSLAGIEDPAVLSNGEDERAISLRVKLSSDSDPLETVLHQFIGMKSRVDRHLARMEAQARLEAGEERSRIWRDTGWFRGVDGHWRHEIDDSRANLLPPLKWLNTGGFEAREIVKTTWLKRESGQYDLLLCPENPQITRDLVSLEAVPREMLVDLLPAQLVAAMDRGEGSPDYIGQNLDDALEIEYRFTFQGLNALLLPQVLQHDELFAAYPELRDVLVQVHAGPGIRGSLGHIEDTGERIILISSCLQQTILMHEIQHIVQEIEGWAQGGSPQGMSEILADERYKMQEIEEKLSRHQSSLRQDARGRIAQSDHDVDEARFVADAWSRMKAEYGERTDHNPYGVDLVEAVTFALIETDHLVNSWCKELNSKLQRFGHIDERELYMRLAGEVEARNTEKRRTLSSEERRTQLPWETADRSEDIQLVHRSYQPVTAHREEAPLPPPVFSMEVGFVSSGKVDIGFRRLDAPGKIARALEFLGGEAQETLIFLALDEDHRPLAILEAGRGGLDNCSFNGPTVMQWSLGIPGAKQLWTAHNHPSGNSSLSAGDISLCERLDNLLKGTHLNFAGMIVIGNEEYSGIYGADDEVSAQIQSNRDPLPEKDCVHLLDLERSRLHQRQTMGFRVDGDEVAALQRCWPETPGVLFTSARGDAIAFVPVDFRFCEALRGRPVQELLLSAAGRCNAAGVLFHLPQHAEHEVKLQMANMAALFSAMRLRIHSSVVSGKWVEVNTAEKDKFYQGGTRTPWLHLADHLQRITPFGDHVGSKEPKERHGRFKKRREMEKQLAEEIARPGLLLPDLYPAGGWSFLSPDLGGESPWRATYFDAKMEPCRHECFSDLDSAARHMLRSLDEERVKCPSQALQQHYRGRISFDHDRTQALIELSAEADRSTLLHEFAHLALEQMKKLAEDEASAAGIRRLWEKTCLEFDIEPGQPISEESHEAFAEGFERYIAEGHAPTEDLQALFAALAAMLSDMLARIMDYRPLSPAAREIYDELLTGDKPDQQDSLEPECTDHYKQGF